MSSCVSFNGWNDKLGQDVNLNYDMVTREIECNYDVFNDQVTSVNRVLTLFPMIPSFNPEGYLP